MPGDAFTLFLIQNTQTGGSNLQLAPGAQADDGLFDVGVLRRMSRGALIKAFGQLKAEGARPRRSSFGTASSTRVERPSPCTKQPARRDAGRHVFHPAVDYYRFKQLALETPEPMVINIDGARRRGTCLGARQTVSLRRRDGGHDAR